MIYRVLRDLRSYCHTEYISVLIFGMNLNLRPLFIDTMAARVPQVTAYPLNHRADGLFYVELGGKDAIVITDR